MRLFELQPILQNEMVIAIPLKEEHFDVLFAAAADPVIWLHHPNKNRYQLKDFTNYFEGAIKSNGAFLVKDAVTEAVIGSTRYCELVQHESMNKVEIGYTFYTRSHWGKGFNHSLKKLMLDHAFCFVDTVYFIIGAKNLPSQASIERLGAVKEKEAVKEYYGEPPQLNFIYAIHRHNREKDNNKT
jgi:RimJ/RimL family protein N-acetyltransferase